MPLIFGFFCFLFYRIMTAAMFDEPLSLVACLLTAAISGVILFAFSAHAAAALGRLAFQRTMNGSQKSKLSVCIGPLAVAGALNFAQMFLIAFGFSERFFDDMMYIGYRDTFYETGIFWFFVISIIPMIAHGIVFMRMMEIAPVDKDNVPDQHDQHQKPRDRRDW